MAACSATSGGPDYWDALVNGGGGPAVIKTGKSRGGCLMAVVERFTGA